MQEQILRDMGFQFRMGSADDPDSLRDMLATVRKIAGLRSKWDSYRVFLFILYRIALVDRAVAHSLRLRPRETEKRATDRALKKGIELINATTRIVDLIPARLRVDRMFARGLVDEVKWLIDRGYSPDLPAMSGLGYKQIVSYLKGETSLEETVQRIKFETHRFARHQYAWFRPKDEHIHWFDIREEPLESIRSLIVIS
jgi:hypothetical protein